MEKIDLKQHVDFRYLVYLNKKDINKQGNLTGFALCLCSLLGFLFPYIIFYGAALFNIDKVTVAASVSHPFYSMVYQIAYSVFTMLLPFSLLKLIVSQQNIGLCPPKSGSFPLVLIGVLFLGVTNILSSVFSSILNETNISNYQSKITLPSGVLGFLISIIAVAVVPALLEEFAFRGVILSFLKPYGEGFAITASALAFSFVHGNLDQIPFAFLTGLGLGYIAVKSGSVWWSVLLHFINNFTSLILTLVNNLTDSSLLLNLTAFIYYAAILLCGVIGFMRLKQDLIQGQNENDPNFVLTKGQKAYGFFGAPFMVIFYLFCLLEIFLSEMSVNG